MSETTCPEIRHSSTGANHDARRATMSDLDALRRAAEGATPGPWACNDEPQEFLTREGRVWAPEIPDGFDDAIGETSMHCDAAFIAAASPDVALALLARLERAEAAVARVGALGKAWAEQATDYDEDTEQQIWDGGTLLRALQGPPDAHSADLSGVQPARGAECHRDTDGAQGADGKAGA